MSDRPTSGVDTRLVLAAILTLAVLAVGIVVERWTVTVPGGEGGPVSVTVAQGLSGRGIGIMLRDKGIIRCPGCFVLTARMLGLARSFRAGTHELSGPLGMSGLVRALTSMPLPPPDHRITVPEGLTIGETAAVAAARSEIDSATFAEHATDPEFAAKLGIDKPTLEGYLYPDTYFIRLDADAETLIRRMVAQFHLVFDDALRARAAVMGMSVHEVVTLASIIEAETGHISELPMVSQVFHRRLELGRPLEANPTIQYALGDRRRVLYEDLSVASPYNTYLHKGLPPGPIANPGAGAIRAALYPVDTDYLYFVADGKGGHVFSRTLSEHTRAVRRYRQSRRGGGR